MSSSCAQGMPSSHLLAEHRTALSPCFSQPLPFRRSRTPVYALLSRQDLAVPIHSAAPTKPLLPDYEAGPVLPSCARQLIALPPKALGRAPQSNATARARDPVLSGANWSAASPMYKVTLSAFDDGELGVSVNGNPIGTERLVVSRALGRPQLAMCVVLMTLILKCGHISGAWKQPWLTVRSAGR